MNGHKKEGEGKEGEEPEERREVLSRRVATAAWLLTCLFLCVKCLIRLIDGIDRENDSMLWFW